MRSFSKNAYSGHLLSGLSYSNIEYLSVADPVLKVVCILHMLATKSKYNEYSYLNSKHEEESVYLPFGSSLSQG